VNEFEQKVDPSIASSRALRARFILAFCLMLASWATIGCGVTHVAQKAKRLVRLSGGKLSMQFTISQAANGNSPVAVDVVLIRDKKFLKTAQDMTASEWFTKKAALRRRHRKTLEVRSWEWVPGHPIDPVVLAVPLKAQAMIFANYASAGPHSALLPADGKVSIALEDQDFTVDGK
jgi:type VI secretion system protein